MNNINITPELLKAVAIVKKSTMTRLYKDLGICNYYSDSYLLKIVRGVKPVSHKFNVIVSDLICERLTTAEIIRAINLSKML